jgi:osmotically-inducible protein OsmY
MKRTLQALIGVAAVVALVACDNTARGAKQDARENQAKAREEGREAAAKTDDAKDKAKEVGGDVKDAAEKAGSEVAHAAKEAGSAIDAGKQTFDVKAALMADSTVDASHIDVDTDAATKTVTLKGSVPTAGQKAAAEKIARSYAAGYTIKNRLTVAKS